MVSLRDRIELKVWAATTLAVAAGLFLAVPASADLQQTARWGGPPPAPPASDEGRFQAIGDLAVGPAGIVGAHDPALGRVQIFESDGEFKWVINDFGDGMGDHASLDIRDDGSVEVFDRVNERLYRFDPDGEVIETIDFSSVFEGQVRDFSQDRSGGYIATFGDELRVARFDPAGNEVVNWPTGRLLTGTPWGGAFVELAEHEIDDQVFVASGNLLGMFSRGGESWANWSLATEECGVSGPGAIDLTLDGDGNVYLLASVSPAENRTTLFKLDDTLNEVWREAVDPGFTQVAIGPDGSVYLAGDDLEIFRFTRTEPAVPVERWKCEKPPVEPKPFELLGLKYGPARAWARVRVDAPEAGTITVTGPKIIRRERAVQAGIHVLTVKARKRFTRPARPRRKLNLKVQVTFRGSTVEATKSLRVHLKGKFRKRPRR